MQTPTRASSLGSKKQISNGALKSSLQSNLGRPLSSLSDRNTLTRHQSRASSGSTQMGLQTSSRLSNRPYSGSRNLSRQSSQSSLSIRRVSTSSLSTIYADGSTFLETGNDIKIQVAIRPKPLENTNESPWELRLENSEIYNEDMGSLNYDHVFSPTDENDKVYEKVAAPVVKDCLNGYSGTIFAYGMTGSGKTYSMKSVVQKSVEALFNSQDSDPIIKTPEKPSSNWILSSDVFSDNSITSDSLYKVKCINVSIMEIYNEKIIDLLNTESSSRNNPSQLTSRRTTMMRSSISSTDVRSNSNREDLRIIDDSKFGVKVVGLKEVKTTTMEELSSLIQLGERSRRVDVTDFNERSSRSHLIIQFKVVLMDKNKNIEDPKIEDPSDIVTCLNFCDLAGSERSTTRTERRKEGAYINKSLLALGTVITKLSQISRYSTSSTEISSKHIPYRDSKLTRILQPSLSGGSIVSILCTIQLGANVIGETSNTLRFALRAKNVFLNVKKIEKGFSSEVLALMKENKALIEEVSSLKMLLENSMVGVAMSPSVANIESQIYSPMTATRTSSIINGDDRYHEVVAENVVLTDQLEHLKRLQESREMNILQNTDLNMELLCQEIEDLTDFSTRQKLCQLVKSIKNDILEERNKSIELTSYVKHLENRVRLLEIDIEHGKDASPFNNTKKMSNVTSLEAKDVEETITELRNSLQRKDAVIKALQSANRLQSVVDNARPAFT